VERIKLLIKYFRMKRSSKVVLYTMGIVEELIDKGLMAGEKLLTSNGIEMFHYLKKRGFKPTEDELKWAVKNMQRRAN